MENGSGHLIKIFGIDREEFISNDFERFCDANGICRQLTTSYLPQ